MTTIAKLFRDFERTLQKREFRESQRLQAARMKMAPKRCEAYARSTGQPCQMKALANGRCRLHGGLSTGPRTPVGREKARANLRQYNPGSQKRD